MAVTNQDFVTAVQTGIRQELQPEFLYLDVTAGTAKASSAVVLDASKGITTITSATITTLTCTTLVLGGNTMSGTELGFLDGVTAGTAAASKALVLDASKGISTITSATITTLTSTTIVVGTASLVEADLLKIDAITDGTVAASKAVVVDANKDAGDFRNLDCVNLDAGSSGAAGTLDVFPTTASKGKLIVSCTDNTTDHTVTITNGAANGANVTITIPALTGYAALSTAALTLAETDVLDGATAGTAVASKAVVLDGSKNHAGISILTLGSNGAGGVVGQVKLSDGANPGYLAIVQTDAQTADLTVHFPDPGAIVDAYVALSTAALTAAEVDVLDGVTPGTAAASKALVLGAGGGITTITSATITTLTCPTLVMTGTTGAQEIQLTTNLADALSIESTAGDIVVFKTTTNAVEVDIAKEVVLQCGTFASSYATGSGTVFTSAITAVGRFYGESTSDLTSAINARVGVFRHLIVTASATVNHETYGLIGQCNVKNTTLAHLHAGLMGTFEVNTAATINAAYTYGVAGVIARIGVGTSILTCTKAVCGFSAMYNGGALASGSAYAYGVDSTTATTWAAALALNKVDNLLYAATGTAYECGVKVASITGVPGTSAAGVIRINIGGTLYFIPFHAAGDITGE